MLDMLLLSLAADDALSTRLAELKALGVRLAIDDFGTAYSSLNYLRRFPVDMLKIAPFVDQIGVDPEQERLVDAIIRLGAMLGLDSVAEEIEQAGQRERLRRLDCRYGQGFLSSPLLPAGEVDVLLRRPLVT
jgi:EAL domain-containing protein (putative c-di-GMP-specific phosphodiesterase class I)